MSRASDEVVAGLEAELEALWRFALRLTADSHDAADLVQRSCLKAIEQKHQYNSQGKLRSWLFTITHRTWLNEMRSRKTKQFHNEQMYNAQIVDTQQQQTELNMATDPEKSVWFDQINEAMVLEIPVGTIMSRLARARIAVGKHLSRIAQPTVEGAQP